MLFDGGYAGINWPKEFGGRGASLSEQLVFYEEITSAGAPNVGVNFVGLLHAGPTLIAEATEEQRTRHLPAILKGEEVWCQGFSEPSAGSEAWPRSSRAGAARRGTTPACAVRSATPPPSSTPCGTSSSARCPRRPARACPAWGRRS